MYALRQRMPLPHARSDVRHTYTHHTFELTHYICTHKHRRWGGRFSLLFESGPNRERSLALLLGFNPDKDYSSTVSQHMGGTLGGMSPVPPKHRNRDPPIAGGAALTAS